MKPLRTSHAALENAALFETLREVMKAKGYTYARLAREIGVSEVTVKRLFASRACTLDRLFQVCEQIGVSLLDVAALAKKEEEVHCTLTPAQERFFAERPGLFAVLKELNHGASVSEVAARWALSAPQWHQALRALEKLGLLEVLEGGRVRLKVRGNLMASHSGPLARKIFRPQTLAFLDHVDRVLENDDVCLHSVETELSREHLEELVEEIHALGRKYRARAYRDRTLLARRKTQSVRWLFAFAPHKTDWRSYKI